MKKSHTPSRPSSRSCREGVISEWCQGLVGSCVTVGEGCKESHTPQQAAHLVQCVGCEHEAFGATKFTAAWPTQQLQAFHADMVSSSLRRLTASQLPRGASPGRRWRGPQRRRRAGSLRQVGCGGAVCMRVACRWLRVACRLLLRAEAHAQALQRCGRLQHTSSHARVQLCCASKARQTHWTVSRRR